MKTKLLFAAALLLSTASFAQSVTAKNKDAVSAGAQASQSGSKTNANLASSSDVTVKSNAAGKTVQKADQAKQETRHEVATQKEAVKAGTSTGEETVQKTETVKSNESSTAHAGVKAGDESGNNKLRQETSLKQQSAVSGERMKGSGKDAENESVTRLKTQTA